MTIIFPNSNFEILEKDQLIKRESGYRSMAGKILGLVAITILLSGIMVLALSSMQDAEAKPAKMSPKHKYSKWYGKKVCGEELCSGTPFYKVPTKIGKSSPNR